MPKCKTKRDACHAILTMNILFNFDYNWTGCCFSCSEHLQFANWPIETTTTMTTIGMVAEVERNNHMILLLTDYKLAKAFDVSFVGSSVFVFMKSVSLCGRCCDNCDVLVRCPIHLDHSSSPQPLKGSSRFAKRQCRSHGWQNSPTE